MRISSLEILRPKEWLKNTFVLAPLIFADRFDDLTSIKNSCVAFLIFCIASSAVYVLNDLVDYKDDSLHAVKKNTKPLPSGHCSEGEAKILLLTLYVLLAFLYQVYAEVTSIALAYLLLNIFYSVLLKKIIFIDIMTIAIGFVLRVLAGVLVLKVPLTYWTFVATFFLALFLASIKRHQELEFHGVSGRKVLTNYSLQILKLIVLISGLFSVSFYLIFVIQERNIMAMTVPFVFIGVGRYFQLFNEGRLSLTPIEAIFSDVYLLTSIIFWVFFGVFAMSLNK